MLYSSFNVSLEKRVAEARIRGEFRMELYREEERMIVELHHLGQVFERGLGADDHAFFFELRDVGVVDFITVTMAFGHNIAVNLVRKRIGRNRHFLRPRRIVPPRSELRRGAEPHPNDPSIR